MRDSLPSTVVIGAMKCGTTALHRYLGAHPQIDMARAKEVNFFNGPETAPATAPDTWWMSGQWHRGVEWYATLFDPAAPVRGETSPGYTSPDHPEVAARMAAVLPDVRLVCLVRDPLDRALSHYTHHHREGSERRELGEALLDPDSQYLSRGRYHERLQPFREHFPADQLLVVVQERLLRDRHRELCRVYAHVGADPEWWSAELEQRWHVGDGSRAVPRVPSALRDAVRERVADDVARLRSTLGDDIPEWDC